MFNLGKASRGERPFDFHRGAPLRFGVLPRYGGAADVVWVDAECCFAYHGAPVKCSRLTLKAFRAADACAARAAVVNCWDDPEHPDRCVVSVCRLHLTRRGD